MIFKHIPDWFFRDAMITRLTPSCVKFFELLALSAQCFKSKRVCLVIAYPLLPYENISDKRHYRKFIGCLGQLWESFHFFPKQNR